MMPPGPQPTMNAASDPNGHIQSRMPPGVQANGSPIPWAEIFSRHETVLSSHLEMLDVVKGHIPPDDEAYRTVSTMVNKSIQAMNQFKVTRKYMVRSSEPIDYLSGQLANIVRLWLQMNKKEPGTTPFASASKMHTRLSPAPQSTDTQSNARRKRARIDRDKENTASEFEQRSEADRLDDAPASKRQRDTASYSGLDEEPQTTSTGSGETEDISAEVQRRLRIKEERRRKKEHTQPEKRKRESLLSNESVSPGASRPQKKRVRTGDDMKKDGEPVSGTEPDQRMKRPKKGRFGR
ncbi:uncharacterized protein N7459_004835 [Penicillium hispanicum]|uniref:uncharacterized protein n=1 Tax=Penicillium hispanicum TaxID=1080232 RepID=UPI00254033C4|nr:uncharacterized protein N7459_004835 [Penicillium hispanicum]KAJ5585035.1 hypothetical protein N7459_004835 [Penicillium hispanicum]